MASYIIQEETLKAIADEVRELTNASEKITPNEIIANIEQVNEDVMTQTDIIEQIQIALSDKVIGENTSVIDYPEFMYTRPSYWLPYPTLTQGDNVNEIWLLIEVPKDMTEYDGEDISNAQIVKDGYKQFWKRIDGTTVGDQIYVVEIHANCVDKFSLRGSVAISSTSLVNRAYFQKLELITGTPMQIESNLDVCSYIRSLKAITNEVYISTSATFNGGIFAETGLKVLPNINYSKGGFKGSNTFRKSPIVDAKSILITSATAPFAGCASLEKIELLTGCTTISVMFQYATNLRNVTVQEGFSSSLYLQYSTQYTSEVLHNIIENLADMTGTTAPTFQVGTDNLAKIDEEHISMLETKNWNYL